MKYLAILFSIYLIGLTLMPCGDVLDAAIDSQSYSVHKESNGEESCSQEACAPFCSCNCCSIGKNIPIQYTVLTAASFNEVSYGLFATSALCDQAVDVWQPPKLG